MLTLLSISLFSIVSSCTGKVRPQAPREQGSEKLPPPLKISSKSSPIRTERRTFITDTKETQISFQDRILSGKVGEADDDNWILLPNASWKVQWDSFITLTVLYTILATPWEVGFPGLLPSVCHQFEFVIWFAFGELECLRQVADFPGVDNH